MAGRLNKKMFPQQYFQYSWPRNSRVKLWIIRLTTVKLLTNLLSSIIKEQENITLMFLYSCGSLENSWKTRHIA